MATYRVRIRPGQQAPDDRQEWLSESDRQVVADQVYGQSSPYGPASLSEAANIDRWRLMLARTPASANPRRFDYEQLTRKARLRAPRHYLPTVSHFTNWIYSLYGVERSRESLRFGLLAEIPIAKQRIPTKSHGGWELLHNGMSGSMPETPFQISSLRIGDRPLRANPDLVFRELPKLGVASGDERIIIVEIKCSSAPVPPDLWPNVRAQLWAYSKIDAFASAREIILVGEVWQVHRGGCGLRCSVSWLKSDPLLEQECRALFDIYSSEYE